MARLSAIALRLVAVVVCVFCAAVAPDCASDLGNVGMATCIVDVSGADVAAPIYGLADFYNGKRACLIVGLTPYSLTAAEADLVDVAVTSWELGSTASVVDGWVSMLSGSVLVDDSSWGLAVRAPGSEVYGSYFDSCVGADYYAVTFTVVCEGGGVESSNAVIVVVTRSRELI